MPITGVGIIVLFVFATAQDGVFHHADDPVFLAVAACLILRGFDIEPHDLRPLDHVRWAAAITLMGASVEKWAHPQWTDPLLAAKPQMTMGAMPELFMQAAGVIAFSLAFALIWTPLVRRSAATFILAIFESGKVDEIGHPGIIVMLVGIAADDARATMQARDAAGAPAENGAARAAFLALYYLGFETLFDTGLQFPERAKLAVI